MEKEQVPDIERRFFSSGEAIQMRMAEGTKEVFSGYAALYNVESEVLEFGRLRFVEVIEPGAFEGADLSNVVARFNHDPLSALARTPDTLRVWADDRGLRYEFDFDPEDPEHVALRAKMKKHIVRSSSFEFRLSDGGDRWDTSGETWRRSIMKYRQIRDVSPVIDPAYPDTSAAIRSAEKAGLDIDAKKLQRIALAKKYLSAYRRY